MPNNNPTSNSTQASVLDQAFAFAAKKHSQQFRKGNRALYISHPMAVASFVMECGGSEEQAAAALLHDVIEDCDVKESELANRFSPAIATLVSEVSEKLKGNKYTWDERKQDYIQQVSQASNQAKLIALCDKYHNLSSFIRDIKALGPGAWVIFSQPPDKIFWYYKEMFQVFKDSSDLQSGRSKVFLQKFEEYLHTLEVELRG